MHRCIIGPFLALICAGCARQPSTQSQLFQRFGAVLNLGASVNGPTFDGGPSLASDGLSLYFASDRPGGAGGADLWIARRTAVAASFELPTNLGRNVNSDANESAPDISADGLVLVFDSDRPGGSGSYDLWITTRSTTDLPFGTPGNLGPGVNSGESEGHPHLSADGLRLYFQGRGPGGFGDADVWMAIRARVSDPFGAAVNLGAGVNTRHFDGEPTVSSDGLTLIFSSDRPGGCGERDLWLAARPSVAVPFGPARHLGCSLNSPAHDVTPSLARDGTVLFFMSNRPGGIGSLDLWMVTFG